METYKQIANQDNNIISAFIYGSQVYGTNHKDSDHDFICVVKDKSVENPLAKLGDVTNYTIEEFQNLINMHEVSVLECLFLPQDKLIKNGHDFNFELNKQTLRNSISSKSSNSWVKCKKKFIVEADFNPYIGKKSAWHALRIIDFGTQIATEGKITDYSRMNSFLPQIMALNSWEEIDTQFRKLYNESSSEFKKVAPKEEALAKTRPAM